MTLLFCLDPIFTVGHPNAGVSLIPDDELPTIQIETIDMARRGIHDEGARVLQERLEGKASVDDQTARRLFTLICVLHFGG